MYLTIVPFRFGRFSPAYFLSVSYFLAALFFLSFTPDSTQAATRIRITLALPEKSLIYETLKIFKDKAENLSGNRISVALFPSAKLYKTPEVPKAVSSGAIEMGAAWLSDYTDVIPAIGIFSLPFMFTNPDMVDAATAHDSAIRKPLEQSILAATNARVLFWVPFPSETFISKGIALNAPDKIAGKKVRVFGHSLPQFIKLCGGVPVPLTGSDQYAVYASKQLDAGITAIEVITSWKLWEVLDTVTLSRPIHEEWVVLINERFWRDLPPEQQRILQEAARLAELAARDKVKQFDEDAIRQVIGKGMKVSEISGDDVEAWKSCSSAMAEEFLEKSGDTGAKVLQAYRKMLIAQSKAVAKRKP